MSTALVTATLFQLQQLDFDMDRLVAEKQSVATLLQGNDELRKARAEHELARQQLQQALKQQREAEWVLDDLIRRLSELDSRLYGGGIGAKELQALQSEAHRLRNQQSQQEDDTLARIEASDTLAEHVEQKRAQLKVADDAWQQEQAGLQQRLTQLEGRIQKLQERRAGLLREVDEHLLKRYENLRRTRQGKAVSRIEQNSCQWCRVILTPSEIQHVRLNTSVQTCMNCGRILYYDRS